MPSPAATKASDKQQAIKKLTTLLQKDYGKTVPKLKLPVVETMLFATCLEDNSWDNATAGYEKLLKSYFDLNEVRVSSVGELEQTLSNLSHADWKGLRIRSILRFVFESTYSFDFEKLTKLTPESAQKRLRKIDFISPFIVNFTLQQVLGCHAICFDEYSLQAAKHLGIVPTDADVDSASEFLKTTIKKSDSFAFSCMLRCFATDPKFVPRLAESVDREEFDVLKVAENLAVLKAPPVKKATPKSAAPKTAAPKAAPAKVAKAEPVATKPKAKPPAAPKKSADKNAAPAKKAKPATAAKAPAKAVKKKK